MPKGVKTPSGEVIHLKTSYEEGARIEPFYTGGGVVLSSDGQQLFTACGPSVKRVSLETGQTTLSISEEEDSVASLAVSTDNSLLAVGWRSVLVKLYTLKTEARCVRSWKAHIGPTVTMAFDPSSTLLATGSTDGGLKVWDCQKYYCTHNFRGVGGAVGVVYFHPSHLQLYSVAADHSIRVWELQTSRCVHTLRGHVSSVTSLAFSGDLLISGGRDQVVLVWDTTSGTLQHTLPVYETVEGVVVAPMKTVPNQKASSEGVAIITAGSKGIIRIWSSLTSDPIHTLEPLCEGVSAEEGEVPQSYSALTYNNGMLVGVTFDHCVLVYETREKYKRTKQLMGYLDEVLDLCYVGAEHIAVATNSEQLKLYHQPTGSCQLLTGHAQIVLCVAVSGENLLTGSRDNTIRLWRAITGEFQCIAIGTGHTHYVGAVALSRMKCSFAVSGSQDCTVKLWSLRGCGQGTEPTSLTVKYTQLAHDKDINALDVSPNDKLFVSGSQDKTIKLWQVKDGALLGKFKGHRRGVWSVKFSPVDQCVASASGDGTVRLWAIANFSCVKTFEGHTNSVLKVVFLSRGMQLASSGSDGLVKVWTVRSGECVASLDGHSERVWALATRDDGAELISGGGDSLVCHWKDVTEKVERAEVEREEELLLRQQELDNLLAAGDHVRAVGLALSLDQPHRLLGLLQGLLEEGGERSKFMRTILSLQPDQQASLIHYSTRWNQNAKHCHVAQSVLAALLGNLSQESFLSLEGVGESIKGFIPYTERHLQRLERLEELSMFVEYSCQKMSLVGSNKSMGRLTQEPMYPNKESLEHAIMAPADSTTTTTVHPVPNDCVDGSVDDDYHDNKDSVVTSTSKERAESKRVGRKARLKRLMRATHHRRTKTIDS